MQLDEALTQIADIRQRMVRAGTFRGYWSVPTAASGVLALIAASLQQRWAGPPDHINIDVYLDLWAGVAILSLIIAGVAMAFRMRRLASAMQRSMCITAMLQFTPCLVAGAMMSSLMLYVFPSIMPGLWMMFFSLGVFASRPLLPRPIGWMGGYYLLGGVLALSGRVDPLAPWTMGLIFGIGQLTIAIMLYFFLERGGPPGEGLE